jgi:hypothetical protein
MTFDIPNFTVPQMGGVMSGVSIPNPNFSSSMEALPNFGLGPNAYGTNIPNAPSFAPSLPPGGGVMAPGQAPPQPPSDFEKVAGTIAGGLKTALPIAGLGLQGLNIKNQFDATRNARDQSKLQRGFQQQQANLQQTQQQSIKPLQQFGTNQLQQASAGMVDPAIQAYIDEWAAAEKAKMQQYFASQGISNSTMMNTALGAIDKQALAMRASIIGQDKNTAIQALQSAMGGTGTAMQGAYAGAQVANQEQNQLDNLIRSSQQALAQLNAMAQ